MHAGRRWRRAVMEVFLATCLAGGAWAGVSSPARAAAPPGTPVGLVVQGAVVRLPAPAFVRAGAAWAPAEDLLRLLGGDARWDAAAGTLRGTLAGRPLAYRAGSRTVAVGNRRVALPAPGEVVAGRLYLPVRPLAAAAGRAVAWDATLGVVVLGRGLGGELPPARVAVNDRVFAAELQPVVAAGTLLFPARPLLESLGYEVLWREDTGTVWFRRHGVRASFRPGEAAVVVNGAARPLPVAPALVQGRAYLPLEALRAAGEQVRWFPAAWAVAVRRGSVGPRAVLAAASGTVEVRRPGEPPIPAAPGTELAEGDALTVAPGGAAEVRLDDGSLVQVAGGTTVEVASLRVHADASRRVSLRVLAGRVVARVARLIQRNSRFEIETPAGVAGVRGTAFVVEVDAQGRTAVAVLSGAVAVRGEAEAAPAVTVTADREVRLGPGVPAPAPMPLRTVTVDRWLHAAAKKALIEEAEDLLAPERPQPAVPGEEEERPLPPPERLLETVKREMGDELRAALPEEREEGRDDGSRKEKRGEGRPDAGQEQSGEEADGTGRDGEQERAPAGESGDGGAAPEPGGGESQVEEEPPPPERDPALTWPEDDGHEHETESEDKHKHEEEH